MKSYTNTGFAFSEQIMTIIFVPSLETALRLFKTLFRGRKICCLHEYDLAFQSSTFRSASQLVTIVTQKAVMHGNELVWKCRCVSWFAGKALKHYKVGFCTAHSRFLVSSNQSENLSLLSTQQNSVFNPIMLVGCAWETCLQTSKGIDCDVEVF